jgi:alkylhydroperoxidase family enzyme
VLGNDLVAAALADHKSAPLDARLHALCDALEVLVRTPEQFSAQTLVPARAAGLSDDALRDAIYVAVLFGTIDRIADALNFRVPPPEDFAAGAKWLLRRGYRM